MAERKANLTELPPIHAFGKSPGNPVGPIGIYQWSEWADGAVWVLDREDLHGRTVAEFRSQAAVYAYKYGFKLGASRGGRYRVKFSSRWDKANEQLWIQFYPVIDDEEQAG